MNRFFRTAYAMTLAYLFATILAVLITGVKVPFAAFSCLYFGLLIALLPAASQKLSGKEPLFGCIGAAVALISGVAAMKLLLFISKKANFRVFSYYCLAVGVIAIILGLTGTTFMNILSCFV